MTTFAPTITLLHREILRFFRQKTRVVGAFGTPVIFWFVMGSGMGRLALGNAGVGENYLHYFFPGTLALIVLFTSIFSTISLILDRQEGFLQSVLVSPVPSSSIVAGKVFGGTLLATLQAAVFLVAAPLVGISLSPALYGITLTQCFLLSFALSSLGILFAWKIDSVQGFHAIMNLLLFPLWFLSGALFPYESAPTWLKTLMLINPMTYGVAAIRSALFATPSTGIHSGACVLIVLFFGLLFFGVSVQLVRRSRR